jgi:hypothetical protein
MINFAKILAVIISLGLLIVFFRPLFFWGLGIILLIIIIRLCADWYWWGKDKGKW